MQTYTLRCEFIDSTEEQEQVFEAASDAHAKALAERYCTDGLIRWFELSTADGEVLL